MRRVETRIKPHFYAGTLELRKHMLRLAETHRTKSSLFPSASYLQILAIMGDLSSRSDEDLFIETPVADSEQEPADSGVRTTNVSRNIFNGSSI